MDAAAGSARSEWAHYWPLPLVAALGNTAAGLHIYSVGPFVAPLTREFGWTRAEVTSGAVIVSAAVALASIPLGRLVDRVGPRRVGLVGVLTISVAVALLGTATGSLQNWLMLWTLVAVCAIPAQTLIWSNAVVSRFDAARGLALAICLCGSSMAIFSLPLVATWLVQSLGWRHAFMALGAIWAAVLYLPLLLWFRGARDGGGPRHVRIDPDAAGLTGDTLGQALRKPAYYKLLFAGGIFIFCMLGVIVHFVPIMTDAGAAPMKAAAAASLIGVFSIVGRLGTGAVLDRFPGHLVGAAAFLIPLPGLALLLANGASGASPFVAAALLGLSSGAEVDVITYLATRLFGLRNFGSIQGGLLCAIAVGSALGPTAAGASFDHFGGYEPFLMLMALFMLTSALLLASLHVRRPEAGNRWG